MAIDVFVVQHVRQFEEVREEVKLIGVGSPEAGLAVRSNRRDPGKAIDTWHIAT